MRKLIWTKSKEIGKTLKTRDTHIKHMCSSLLFIFITFLFSAVALSCDYPGTDKERKLQLKSIRIRKNSESIQRCIYIYIYMVSSYFFPSCFIFFRIFSGVLNPNLRSKSLKSFTETSKWMKTILKTYIFWFLMFSLSFSYLNMEFPYTPAVQ